MRNPRVKRFDHKGLLSVEPLFLEDNRFILDTAEFLEKLSLRVIEKVPALRGKGLVSVFLEPSTMKRMSLEIGAKRLRADIVSLSGPGKSAVKGGTLIDTRMSLKALNTNLIVVGISLLSC